MKKLYYIKCDDFICDVTDRYDHAQQLGTRMKAIQKDKPQTKSLALPTTGRYLVLPSALKA